MIYISWGRVDYFAKQWTFVWCMCGYIVWHAVDSNVSGEDVTYVSHKILFVSVVVLVVFFYQWEFFLAVPLNVTTSSCSCPILVYWTLCSRSLSIQFVPHPGSSKVLTLKGPFLLPIRGTMIIGNMDISACCELFKKLLITVVGISPSGLLLSKFISWVLM